MSLNGSIVSLEALQPLHSANLNEAIQERLSAFIRQEGFGPNKRLPSQTRLAERLGVSLASLREALRALEALGILEVRVGSGWYVREFSFDAISKTLLHSAELNDDMLPDLNDIRTTLEVAFIEHAARTLTPQDVDELSKIVDEMVARARAGSPWTELDGSFHRKLYSRIRNGVFTKLMDVFWSLFIYQGVEVGRGESVSEAETHYPIVAALKLRDVEAAKRHLASSLSGSKKRTPRARSERMSSGDA